jgi:biopolymer transport protein ExbB
MKSTAIFLALCLSTAPLFGQEPAAGTEPRLNPAAVTSPNKPAASANVAGNAAAPGTGAGVKREGSSGVGGAVNRVGAGRKNLDPVKLWTLVESGGWAMIPLGVLSVLTGMLVLVYLFTLRRGSIVSVHYMNTADVLLKKRDYLGLLAISNRHSEAVARVVRRTLDFLTKNPNATYEVVREIAETEGQGHAAVLQHRTTYLADIGTLAPMVGLLGTVVGIIQSFGVLGSNQAGTASRDLLLASGVSEALVATATGLIIGIVAMGFHSLFRNRVQRLISDLEIATAHILALVAINYQKKREGQKADE